MRRLAGRSIFSLGEHEFRWEDVVLAAYLWGEMPALERRIGQNLAAQKRLADIGEALSDEEVQTAANAWRYERNLISADDTESWLAARELSLDEWLDYVRRSASRTRCQALKTTASRHHPSSEEIEAAMYGEVVCSGTIGDLIDRLAGRAAIYERVTRDERSPRTPTKAELRTLLDRVPRETRQRRESDRRRTDHDKRAEALARMSLSFERFIGALLTPAALQREIEAHALEWTHLHCRTLVFGDEGPALEAALLVREDGLTIEKAAAIAKSAVLEAHYVLEEVDAPLRDRLLGALPGDLVGPIQTKDGFLMARVTDRVEPSRDEPLIRERARGRIVQRTVQTEIDKRITWHERF